MGPPARLLTPARRPLVDEKNEVIDVPDFSQQKTLLKDILSDAPFPVRLRHEAATPKSFLNNLAYGPKIIHFTSPGSAHGGEDGSLVLEDGKGGACVLTQKMLRMMTSGLRGMDKRLLPEVVVVLAPHSEKIGQTFADSGIPHVIAVRQGQQLTDEAAQLFLQTFYHWLLGGNTVQNAFNIGVGASRVASDDDAGEVFVLLPSQGYHGGKIEFGPEEAQVMSAAPEEWACPACTFLNSLALKACEICGKQKGKEEKQQIRTSRRAGGGVVDVSPLGSTGSPRFPLPSQHYVCDPKLMSDVLALFFGRKQYQHDSESPPVKKKPQRLVSLLGGPDAGQKDLASAVGRYMAARQAHNQFSHFYWVDCEGFVSQPGSNSLAAYIYEQLSTKELRPDDRKDGKDVSALVEYISPGEDGKKNNAVLLILSAAHCVRTVHTGHHLFFVSFFSLFLSLFRSLFLSLSLSLSLSFFLSFFLPVLCCLLFLFLLIFYFDIFFQ